jgi:hypothetical protein
MTYEHACLGRGPTDNNNSIPCFGFSVFSVIWGICFSLKANPNGMKTSDSGTLLAQGTRLLLQQRRPYEHLPTQDRFNEHLQDSKRIFDLTR